MRGRSRGHLRTPGIDAGQSLRSWPCKGVHSEGAAQRVAQAIVAPAERSFVNLGFGCVSMASSRFFCVLAC